MMAMVIKLQLSKNGRWEEIEAVATEERRVR